LHRNCLLEQVIEGKIKGWVVVTGRRGRRRRKPLDDLKERRKLDRMMWTARFGRGFRPVVRQTTKLMNVELYRNHLPVLVTHHLNFSKQKLVVLKE
jgi:hypothetical protein